MQSFCFYSRAEAYLGRSQSGARRAKSQTCLSTFEPKLPMGEINRSRNPRRQSISQKSARRLEISAVLAEFSKRLVNFCSPQVCFSDKVSGMRGPVAETDGCRSVFFRLGTKHPSSPLCMLPLHIKKAGCPLRHSGGASRQ